MSIVQAMSFASIAILTVGSLFIGVRLARMARLWRDMRANRAAERAAELAFTVTHRTGIHDLGRKVTDEDLANESPDLGVALALALREAQAEATGKGNRLDAPSSF